MLKMVVRLENKKILSSIRACDSSELYQLIYEAGVTLPSPQQIIG